MLVKIKDFLINNVATKDTINKEKHDVLESQLKEILSRFEILKGEKSSDLLRIDKLLADNEDLESRLAQSMEDKILVEKSLQVPIIIGK